MDRRHEEPGPPPDIRTLLSALAPCDWIVPAEAGSTVDSVGYFHPTLPSALMVLGEAGHAWLGAASSEQRRDTWAALQRAGLRAVLVDPAAREALPPADERPPSLAIASSNCRAHEAVWHLRRALATIRAPKTTVHGVLLEVFGLGILITGAAGVGKSELALELLARGHRFVADDAVELRRQPGGLLEGASPAMLKDFLEVRSLGILDVRSMYGHDAVLDQRRIDLTLKLDRSPHRGPDAHLQRLHGRRGTHGWLGIELPQITLHVTIGHNLATLVEAACRDFWLRSHGRFADQELALRQRAEIDAS